MVSRSELPNQVCPIFLLFYVWEPLTISELLDCHDEFKGGFVRPPSLFATLPPPCPGFSWSYLSRLNSPIHLDFPVRALCATWAALSAPPPTSASVYLSQLSPDVPDDLHMPSPLANFGYPIQPPFFFFPPYSSWDLFY